MERKINWWFLVGMFVVVFISGTLIAAVSDQMSLSEPYRRLVTVLVAFTVIPAYFYLFYREKFGRALFALWGIATLIFSYLSVLDESTLSGTNRRLLIALVAILLFGGIYLLRRFRR